tara:strand:+ start:1176 stop:2039 length:864 start_codon:yes stop_codon:yes gene_type:complete
MVWRRLVHEPLTQFLVAGVVLFALSVWFDDAFDRGRYRIDVTQEKITQLQDTWTKQRGEPPTEDELDRLVEDHIREEVLYREALASGLDQGDTIVRRRLVQKVEFLAQNLALALEPSELELQSYFDRHYERYLVPDQIAFGHVYFRQGDDAMRKAEDTLETLIANHVSVVEAVSLGDRFMLQQEYPLQTEREIQDLFGRSFVKGLADLPLRRWKGPIHSSYGLHVVQILQKVPSYIPELSQIRGQVLLDLNEERLRSASDEYYQDLRGKFDITIVRDEEIERNVNGR